MSNKNREVIDAKENSNGNITHVRITGNTNWTPINTAISMTKAGQLENVHVSTTATGKEYLRTNPDGRTTNNLNEMARD